MVNGPVKQPMPQVSSQQKLAGYQVDGPVQTGPSMQSQGRGPCRGSRMSFLVGQYQKNPKFNNVPAVCTSEVFALLATACPLH